VRKPSLLSAFIGWSFLPIALLAALALVALEQAQIPLLALLCLALLCLTLLPSTPLVALVLLLTLAPLRALIATEADWSLPLDIGQLLFLLLLFCVLLQQAQRSHTRLQWHPANAPLLATVALCAVFAIGAWRSASLSLWLSEWLKWLGIALLIWLLPQLDEGGRWLQFALITAAVANALVGLYIFFGGSGADHLLILGRFYRAFGTFGQPNPFGGFMGLSLALSLMTAWHEAAQSWRIAREQQRLPAASQLLRMGGAALAALLIAAALLASWSRGAWIGCAVALLALLLAAPRRIEHGLALAASAALLFVVLGALGLLPDALQSRLSSSFNELIRLPDVRGVDIHPGNYASIERLAHWQAALNMATDAPYLGIGLGNYAALYEQYRLLNWPRALGHAHNIYLNLLAETGILGLSAYVLYWLLILRWTWQLRQHPDPGARRIALGLLGSWAYLAVHSLFDNLYVNNMFFHIGVHLALLTTLRRQLTRALVLE